MVEYSDKRESEEAELQQTIAQNKKHRGEFVHLWGSYYKTRAGIYRLRGEEEGGGFTRIILPLERLKILMNSPKDRQKK